MGDGFLKETDYLLIELAKAHDVRGQRNFQVVSEMWEVITAQYNAKTGSNFTKKQLQKRLTNLTYRFRKLTNTLSTDGLRSAPLKSLEELTNTEFEMKYEDWNTNPEAESDQVALNDSQPEPLVPVVQPDEVTNEQPSSSSVDNEGQSMDMKKSDKILLKLAKEHDIRHIRNIQVLTEVWEEVKDKFNKATGFNLTKKQCQKKLANLVQRQRKLQALMKEEEGTKDDYDEDYDDNEPLSEDLDSTEVEYKEPRVEIFENNYDKPSKSNIIEADDYEQLRVRAEIAKEEAELKRAQAEEMRLKKEELLAEAAKVQIVEAKRKAEIAELELKAKRRQLESILNA